MHVSWETRYTHSHIHIPTHTHTCMYTPWYTIHGMLDTHTRIYSQSHLGWHFRILFQRSKLKARTSLFTETWQKTLRALSFELSKMSPQVGLAVPRHPTQGKYISLRTNAHTLHTHNHTHIYRHIYLSARFTGYTTHTLALAYTHTYTRTYMHIPECTTHGKHDPL